MKHKHQSTSSSQLRSALPADLQQILSYGTETGTSFCLIALPVEEHRFAFYKGAFKDVICYVMGGIH